MSATKRLMPFSASFELPEWFPKSLVDRITQAQAAREG
jgi:hypothetical protein